jgi:hypothetical protein
MSSHQKGKKISPQDLITINVHEAVVNGDQLADLTNRVLGNYQGAARYMGPPLSAPGILKSVQTLSAPGSRSKTGEIFAG